MLAAFTPAELDAIALSVKVATAAALGALPVGVALGWLLARCRFPGKGLLDALLMLPLVLPPVVTGYLLLIGFGTRGPIGGFLREHFGLVFAFRWTGAALAAAIMGLPLMVRAARLSFEAIDPALDEAARVLGAPRWQRIVRIHLPLALPGIAAGMVLAFARALGEFGATITFVSAIPGETETLSTAIYGLMQVPGGEAGVWRLAWVAIALSLAAVMASEWLVQRQRRMLRGG